MGLFPLAVSPQQCWYLVYVSWKAVELVTLASIAKHTDRSPVLLGHGVFRLHWHEAVQSVWEGFRHRCQRLECTTRKGDVGFSPVDWGSVRPSADMSKCCLFIRQIDWVLRGLTSQNSCLSPPLLLSSNLLPGLYKTCSLLLLKTVRLPLVTSSVDLPSCLLSAPSFFFFTPCPVLWESFFYLFFIYFFIFMQSQLKLNTMRF